MGQWYLRNLDILIQKYLLMSLYQEMFRTQSSYLGHMHSPFETQSDPAVFGPFSVPNFSLTEGISYDRVSSRRNLISGMDNLRRDVDNSGQLESFDKFTQQSFDLLTSKDHFKCVQSGCLNQVLSVSDTV